MTKVVDSSKPIYSIYITCCLGLFLSTLDTGIINLALNTFSIDFCVSLEYIGLSVTLYLLFLILFLVPGGWLGDFWGQKIALIAGFVLFGLTSLIAGFSGSANQLIIARCGQGIGAALLQANCLGLAGLQSSKQKIRLNSFIMLAISLGPILGPSFGGVILKLWGWQFLFLINVPLCIVGCFFSLKITKAVNTLKRETFDLKGMILFFMMLVACVSLIYSDNLNLLLIEKNFIGISTLIIFLFFLRIESKCSNPFFPVKLLFISSIRYISIGSLVFGLTAGIIFSASPLMFIREADYPIDYIGLICTAAPIGVILSVFGRKVINSSCNKIILIYALPLMLFAFALLFFVSFNISIFNYVIAALCYGLGGGLFQGSLIQIAMDQKKDKQSTIGGLLRLFQNGGIIIGSACSLMLLEAKISPLENISTYQKLWGITFSVLSIMFVYSYVSLFRIKK
ncbi:MFS transporter [Snodgrassella sp. ESL0304]|uniref:MFS transporter n=1 Tax=Snodgrassella sp. ESL0304 TaxID=2705032 RepID=UPI0015820178|nr:MFS transporter [Snodgrassella sp. ESL0304]NUE79770.1 MFS transporter [Snodgrassella sp. ESL0304]